MRIVSTGFELKDDGGCVFVPTMGALHEGHFTLVREARRIADATERPVVVSVFVNPTQFNDPKDLERYPRTLEADAEGCRKAGADVVFAPSVTEMYPPGLDIPVPPLPPVATRPGLEDAKRPGHFAGVCQVVKRLFELVNPRQAVFGEKDWQQLQVIRAMVEMQGMPIEIVGIPTVREESGLAMSSRNVFLSPNERRQAASLYRSIGAAQQCDRVQDAERTMQRQLEKDGLGVEYAVVRDARTLEPVDGAIGPARDYRCLIAARLGAVRLIDNARWHPVLQGIV